MHQNIVQPQNETLAAPQHQQQQQQQQQQHHAFAPQSAGVHYHHHHQPHVVAEHSTTGLAVDLSANLEVYNATLDSLLIVPRSDIVQMPDAAVQQQQQQQHNNGTKVTLQLCPSFDADAAYPESSCPAGTRCKYVHARVAAANVHSIHVNYAWSHPDEVIYERFPAGQMMSVAPPNANVASDEIPSHLVLKTRALQSNRRVISHCAHYYFNRTCNRGGECFFIHAVSLNPATAVDCSAPGAAPLIRRIWGRTQQRRSLADLAAAHAAQVATIQQREQELLLQREKGAVVAVDPAAAVAGSTGSSKNSRRGSKSLTRDEVPAGASGLAATTHVINNNNSAVPPLLASATATAGAQPQQQKRINIPMPMSAEAAGYATTAAPGAEAYAPQQPQQQQYYYYSHQPQHHAAGALPSYHAAQTGYVMAPGGYSTVAASMPYYGSQQQQQQQQYQQQPVYQYQQQPHNNGSSSQVSSGAVSPMYGYTPNQQHMTVPFATPPQLTVAEAQPAHYQQQAAPAGSVVKVGAMMPVPRSRATTNAKGSSSSLSAALSMHSGVSAASGINTPPATLSSRNISRRESDDEDSGSSLENTDSPSKHVAAAPTHRRQDSSSNSTPVSPARRHHNPYSMTRTVIRNISRDVSRDDLTMEA